MDDNKNHIKEQAGKMIRLLGYMSMFYLKWLTKNLPRNTLGCSWTWVGPIGYDSYALMASTAWDPRRNW